MIRSHYEPFDQNQFYIDKTAELEKGIAGFPFIYIEGFAACGKTTMVRMLLAKHPEIAHCMIDLSVEYETTQLECELRNILEQMNEKPYWIIFENINAALKNEVAEGMVSFLREMPSGSRAILIGRERPDARLLPLVWERKMEIIPQEALLFSGLEIQKFVMEMECELSAEDILRYSGGWAGCVDMMLRLAKRYATYAKRDITAGELRKSYEIEAYIQHTMIDSLSGREQALLQKSLLCPWVNQELCSDLFGFQNAEEDLQKLSRKGILQYDARKRCWKTAPVFAAVSQVEDKEFLKKLNAWYDERGHAKEAIACARRAEDPDEYLHLIQKYYREIGLSEIPFEMLRNRKEDVPEFCYLRGLYDYLHRAFRGLDKEILRLEKMDVPDEHKKYEILLNLYYLRPDISLSEWIHMLEKYGEKYGKFQLYHILGYSNTYLCGLRDLTGLFACTKKEEKQNARIWKAFLGKEEWKCYQLARMDYYLETERQSAIPEEDWELLRRDQEDGREAKQIYIARLYLLGKLQRMEPSAEHEQQFMELSRKLRGQEDEGNVRNAIVRLYSRWTEESRLLVYWLRYSESAVRAEITEENYAELFFMAKGYLQLNQFEKAERILKRLIPYLQTYHRTRFLAESLFQQAVVNWKTEHHGQALQSVIQSFIINGRSRYVGFYTSYGQAGQEVLEAYEEWYRTNMPEEWSRKKKYQYGNVLRMPEADYIGVVLRCVKREVRASHNEQGARRLKDEMAPERLTMMETLALQYIEKGYSNAKICEELNLKLSTVKTHIYSLYKKLGVNSRVQAVKKGKETGILK